MKVGILGSGAVGQTLASGFLSEGYEVMLGTRDPAKESVVRWKKANPSGETGTLVETARYGELLVLSVEGLAAEEAVKSAGLENFKDKIVIDTTNPTKKEPPTQGVLHFFTTLEQSLLERLQKLLPSSKLVKAFNSVGSAYMYKPSFPGGTPTMFICGNDPGAKKTVSEILVRFGFEPEDMGMVESARAIEPLCILWCIPGMLNNQWKHAFKLLKAKP